MLEVAKNEAALLGSELGVPRHGDTLDSGLFVRALAEEIPGIHADWGGRQNIFHPRIDEWQGLFYMHKHITAMDRGRMRQWPEWLVERQLVEVPIAEALLHDDCPIIAMTEDGEAEVRDQATAIAYRNKPFRVQHIGWAHVVWKVLHFSDSHALGLRPGWFAETFRLPMDWYTAMKTDPIRSSFIAADQSCPGEKSVAMRPIQ